MEKYKVCPACKERNLPTIFECSKCDTDLMNVRVVDENSERMLANPRANTEAVRICECGISNPAGARKCSVCGEDISDIQPTNTAVTDIAQFILFSLDGSYTFSLTEPLYIVGREQAMKENLSTKTYVSRSHAKLTITNGELYITNLSHSNFTFVNNEKIADETPKHLADGDEVGLGGLCLNGTRQDQAAYFIVRIGPCM